MVVKVGSPLTATCSTRPKVRQGCEGLLAALNLVHWLGCSRAVKGAGKVRSAGAHEETLLHRALKLDLKLGSQLYYAHLYTVKGKRYDGDLGIAGT